MKGDVRPLVQHLAVRLDLRGPGAKPGPIWTALARRSEHAFLSPKPDGGGVVWHPSRQRYYVVLSHRTAGHAMLRLFEVDPRGAVASVPQIDGDAVLDAELLRLDWQDRRTYQPLRCETTTPSELRAHVARAAQPVSSIEYVFDGRFGELTGPDGGGRFHTYALMSIASR